MSGRAGQLTPAQQRAITARGNLLVTAGAGTGKTQTLVARCLRLVGEERCSLENILMVTFTEAAAAEMRQRIRGGLERRRREQPGDAHLAGQLALLEAAHISTLHAFCLHLVRQHFYELGIDPQVTVLDEEQTAPLIRQTLDELLDRLYGDTGGNGVAFRALAQQAGGNPDARIRALVLRLHRYTQSLADPAGWFEREQANFRRPEPVPWRDWFREAVARLQADWLPQLQGRAGEAPAVARFENALAALPVDPSDADVVTALQTIAAADAGAENWPHGTRTRVRDGLKRFLEEAAFLAALVPAGGRDPLAEDWEWSRHAMLTLLRLAREFTAAFSRAKRALGGVDFADLEQFALRLLCDEPAGAPTATARQWQEQFHHVFVDEYQDINGAQDAIVRALSRGGGAANRFLVGDVKQSIYRFRRANPKIFAGYTRAWSGPGGGGATESLADNFRSREALLNFINPLFGALLSAEIGGVDYEPLRFGAPDERGALAAGAPAEGSNEPAPRVELHLISKDTDAPAEGEPDDGGGSDDGLADLVTAEREARLVARRLREWREAGHAVWDREAGAFRPVRWGDMVVLLRSPAGRVECFAKEFHRAGVPLLAGRAGFFASLEISDLLHLLRLLDNPLQDVPLLAVLRSPLVALSLDELAVIRAHNDERSWWLTLQRFYRAGAAPEPLDAGAWAKAGGFLRAFESWRGQARQGALSDCLERVLAETHYEALLLAGPRGPERAANVRRLLGLARRFDPYQRQGLFRFLQFVAAQEEAGRDLEPAPTPAGDAVRLLSIHQSKGLEFPVVALAGLGTGFNEQDLKEPILLSETRGLCPRVTPPGAERSYPSLAHWLGRREERRELLGEELRLLYVAVTRARDTLLLVGTARSRAAGQPWDCAPPDGPPLSRSAVAGARSHLDWLRLWLPRATAAADWRTDREGGNRLLRWRIAAQDDAVFAAEASDPDAMAAAGAGDSTADVAAVDALRGRLAWEYPQQSAGRLPAKTSVSALRRRLAEEPFAEALPMFEAAARRFPLKDDATGTPHLTATDIGTAHHLFLQLVSLDQTGGGAELRREAERLRAAGTLTAEQAAALDFEALTGFWQNPVGRRIRDCPAGTVHRELPFTARFRAGELTALGLLREAGAAEGEFIVVQGFADLVVTLERELWLVDFKTDRITAAEEAERARAHAPQVALYAAALDRIYGRPVTQRWLHFLALGRSVEV